MIRSHSWCSRPDVSADSCSAQLARPGDELHGTPMEAVQRASMQKTHLSSISNMAEWDEIAIGVVVPKVRRVMNWKNLSPKIAHATFNGLFVFINRTGIRI